MILFLLTLFQIMYGQSILPTEASVVAQNYYNTYNLTVPDSGLHVPAADKQVSSVIHWNKADSTYLYFVNMQGGGWVLVANEQRYTPVLGFSTTDSVALSDTLNMPPALRALLNDYMSVIDSIRQNNDVPSAIIQAKWNRLKTIGIEKDSIKATYQRSINQNYGSYNGSCLLGNNMWGQSNPNVNCDKSYNKFCPDFFNVSCGRTVVGCTAVAMAQVMRYWQWPDYANIAPTIDMCGTTYGTSVPHYYDWDYMPNQISSNTDMYQVDMIAGLLRDCGYAAHMIYSGLGSAAVLSYAQYALHDIFKYNDADIVSKIGKSDEEWGNLMRTEINWGRPVICQATSYDNNEIAIHTFVVDGYQINTDMFHIIAVR